MRYPQSSGTHTEWQESSIGTSQKVFQMPISFGKWHVRLGKSFAAGGKCGSSSASYAKFWEVGQSIWLKLEAPHTPSPNLKL